MTLSWDIIVVGGGAAGLWAGGTAAARGRRTLVLEKNRKAGVKILISGGTRCNLTQHGDSRSVADAFGGPQTKFLYSPLSRLSPRDVVATVEALGVPTKIEETGKIFPCSDRAVDVRNALVRRLIDAGGTLRTGASVRKVIAAEGALGFRVVLDDGTLDTDRVILATGGLSYPGCGTTGDGYSWVQALGHQVISPRPALTPLCTHAPWVTEWQGITLADATISVTADGTVGGDRTRLVDRGGMLFTHFGLSGPAPMNVSRYLSADAPVARSVQLDLLPSVPTDELIQRMTPGAGTGPTKVVAVLRTLLPRRVADHLMEFAEMDANCPLAELSRTARQRLLAAIKSRTVPIAGTLGYRKAEVTAGGVDLREVDSRTMESRIAPGLFLVGEILDLDGPIGGYNFQAAFSTGHVAGLNA